MRFSKLMDTNVNLTSTPPFWERFKIENPQYASFHAAYWNFFLVYLVINQGITPHSAFGYETGAKWFLANVECIDTSFIDRSRIIKNTKQGLMNVWLCNDANKQSQRRRLGASRDLIMTACLIYLRNHTDWQNLGATMFLKCAYMMCARKSDLIVVPDQNQHLKNRHVNFTVVESNGNERLITSLSILNFPLRVITAVHLETHDMKNDQAGEGHRHTYSKLTDFDNEDTFCIVTDCYNWIKASQPRHGLDPFLSYPSKDNPATKRTVLNPSYPLAALRKAGEKCDIIDHKRLTLYSPRIGATTTLAAEGENPLTIKFAGDWGGRNGDSYMRYIRDTLAFSDRISRALQFSDKFKVKDMKKWCTSHNIMDDLPMNKYDD